MCLAMPGIVKSISGDEALERKGIVVFGGVEREINLSCLPDVKVGDYIIAHAGVALQLIDEVEAQKIIADLGQLTGEG